jgi:hypothetical protein
MKLHRSINEPLRDNATWEELWSGEDQGLVACWERGREKSLEDIVLANQALAGQLVVLPWKGGVEKAIKLKQKYGSLRYFAMLQGLRGEDLDLDIEREVVRVCSITNMTVIFTNDITKFAEA